MDKYLLDSQEIEVFRGFYRPLMSTGITGKFNFAKISWPQNDPQSGKMTEKKPFKSVNCSQVL